VKLRKDIELLTVQHESSEASLRKRHQEAIAELNEQIEQLSKHRNKSVRHFTNSRSPVEHGCRIHRICKVIQAIKDNRRTPPMTTPFNIVQFAMFYGSDVHISKAYITIAIRLRYDYDEKLTCSFFARIESRRIGSRCAVRAIRRSRIVVVS